jgi:hypothetical protein
MVILIVALGSFASSCNRGRATTATPLPEVEVATVETRDVPVYSEWVATLDGYVNAQIRPQVSGYIIRSAATGNTAHLSADHSAGVPWSFGCASRIPQRPGVPRATGATRGFR